MKNGKLIVFEGLDNAGKSTVIKILSKQLNSIGVKTVCTRELTTQVGKLTRRYVRKRAPSVLKTLLFAADRIERQEKDIKPALEKGITVLSDRWFFSALAYRMAEVGNLRKKEIKKYVNLVNKYDLRPNLVFFLDIPARESIRRGKPNKKNNYGLTFLKEVRENYECLFRQTKAVRIDAQKPLKTVVANIYAVITHDSRL